MEMESTTESTLALGWQSGILIASTYYLKWLDMYNKTEDNIVSTDLVYQLCDVLPTLWSENVGKTLQSSSIYGETLFIR